MRIAVSRQPGAEPDVSPLELFFDLVYVGSQTVLHSMPGAPGRTAGPRPKQQPNRHGRGAAQPPETGWHGHAFPPAPLTAAAAGDVSPDRGGG